MTKDEYKKIKSLKKLYRKNNDRSMLVFRDYIKYIEEKNNINYRYDYENSNTSIDILNDNIISNDIFDILEDNKILNNSSSDILENNKILNEETKIKKNISVKYKRVRYIE